MNTQSKIIPCPPEDLRLKSFFLGPQAENASWVQELVKESFQRWFDRRKNTFPSDGIAISEADRRDPATVKSRELFRTRLDELFLRFEHEVPRFSPRYIGHMLSEISLPALFGHIVTLLHNPNNISGDSSQAGVRIEAEAVSFLLEMIGMSASAGTGHFTSGGTIANFEALVRARKRQWTWIWPDTESDTRPAKNLFEAAHRGWSRVNNPIRSSTSKFIDSVGSRELIRRASMQFGEYKDPILLIANHRHYSWPKGMSLLGLGSAAIRPVELDATGRMDPKDLARKIEQAAREGTPILAVVTVAGTTELGQVDPIDEVSSLLSNWTARGIHIWHHSDAAYGGFLASTLGADSSKDEALESALRALRTCDSLSIDPHKLGYVPYASGAFLCREKRDYYLQSVNAPYLAFEDPHERGPQTLEGSRSAAGAVATWLTARTIGLDASGYGRILGRTVENRRQLEARLRSVSGIRVAPGCSTNVLGFSVARSGESLASSNARTLRIRDGLPKGETDPFYVSGTRLQREAYGSFLERHLASWSAQVDDDGLEIIRLVLMNPFFSTKETHVSYGDEFIAKLEHLMKENFK